MGDGARRGPTRRRRISFIGVLGELLITGGVFVLLFLVWQLWFNDLVVGNQLHNESLEQSAGVGARCLDRGSRHPG